MEQTAIESELELIQTTLQNAKPHSIVQVGAGNYEHAKTIIETARDLPSTRLTMLINDADNDTVAKLRQHQLDQWVDFIQLPADQVLPDFYFQEHTFDFAVINPSYGEQETRIAFYYISKLLDEDCKLIVNEAPNNGLRALCRYVLGSGDYAIFATSGNTSTMPWLERLLRDTYQKLPQAIKTQTDQLINPTLLETDPVLGLWGNTIVFNKLTSSAPQHEEDIVDVDAMIEAMM
jgi:hypothetical protein